MKEELEVACGKDDVWEVGGALCVMGGCHTGAVGCGEFS